tara:strand:+ start:5503 stop:6024 length:522 start_codon:yes stop_codon:yes gene_type:complete
MFSLCKNKKDFFSKFKKLLDTHIYIEFKNNHTFIITNKKQFDEYIYKYIINRLNSKENFYNNKNIYKKIYIENNKTIFIIFKTKKKELLLIDILNHKKKIKDIYKNYGTIIQQKRYISDNYDHIKRKLRDITSEFNKSNINKEYIENLLEDIKLIERETNDINQKVIKIINNF